MDHYSHKLDVFFLTLPRGPGLHLQPLPLDETTCTTSTGTTTSTASHNPETWGAKLGDFNGFQWILGLISISILILDVFNDVRVFSTFDVFWH